MSFFQDKIWMNGFNAADKRLTRTLTLDQFRLAVEVAQESAKAKDTNLVNETNDDTSENLVCRNTE